MEGGMLEATMAVWDSGMVAEGMAVTGILSPLNLGLLNLSLLNLNLLNLSLLSPSLLQILLPTLRPRRPTKIQIQIRLQILLVPPLTLYQISQTQRINLQLAPLQRRSALSPRNHLQSRPTQIHHRRARQLTRH